MSIIKLGKICNSISETKKSKIPQLVINTSDVLMNSISPKLEMNKVLGQFKKTAKLGDILFSEIRPGNGRWALVESNINECLISTKMLVLRPKNNLVLSKFLYFLITTKIVKKIVSIAETRSGTFPQITFNEIKNIKTFIPDLKEQQKIIDIIEPIEKLFLRYSNIVRIDSYQNCKKDLKILIDIIEPIKSINNVFEKFNEKLILLLSKFGELVVNNKSGVEINYIKQSENGCSKGLYVQTANIGNFDNRIKNKIFYEKLPSRAKLNFTNDIFYISKLDGEKKFIYRKKCAERFIISNGMWGIFANENKKYVLFVFLMSDLFYKSKKIEAIGTTMRAINDSILKLIINRYKFNEKYNVILKYLFELLSNITMIIEKLSIIKNKMVDLLIK